MSTKNKITAQDLATKNIHIQCDECKADFPVDAIEPEQTTIFSLGLGVCYWRCPKCGHAYVVHILDRKQLRLDKDFQAQTALLERRHKLGKTISKARIKQLQNLKSKSEAYQQELKSKFLAAVTSQLNKEDATETNS